MPAPLHFSDVGTGQTVTLIHGFPLDSRIYDAIVPMLAEKVRVVTVDLPGFGRSAPAVLTMSSMAAAVHETLAAIDATPCVLAGLSMGGYVAQQFAIDFPADLNGLVLIDTKPDADTPEQRAARDAMAKLARDEGSGAVAIKMFPNMLADETGHADPRAAETLRTIMRSQPPETLAAACIAMRDRPDYSEALRTLGVPLVAVAGEHDRITPPGLAERMAKLAPEGRWFTIPDAGHMAPLENPRAVVEAILSLFEIPGGGT
jgi:3-oxoadipate enol-lactonase